MQSSVSMDDEELAALSRLSALRTWATIVADYAAIVGLAWLAAAFAHPIVTAGAVLLIARQQHAVTILIHEGVHYRLFVSRRLNDLVCRWLLAAPLFLSFDGYRATHLGHHRHTMTEDDPDFTFVRHFPVSRRRFLLSFAPDFVGITYAYLVLHYSRSAAGNGSRRRIITAALPGVVVNGAALAVMSSVGLGTFYLVYWLVPMLCVLPFLLHVRGLCEHGGHHPDPDPMKCTWTVLNPAECFFLAPHHINYHVEHHGYPRVPHFNLPQLHSALKQRAVLPTQNVRSSYSVILKQLISTQ